MIYSIDVECVATGIEHNARSVAQISLVDQAEQVLLNLYVQQTRQVVSYLTPLTGVTKEILESRGIPLEQAIGILKSTLPRDAILVGQNISKDVEWLGLKEGVDFGELRDLTGLFRVHNPKYKTTSVFSQDHLAKYLLDWDISGAHDAVGDAIKSIRLFKLHQMYHQQPEVWGEMCRRLLESPPTMSFSRRYPSFEGVCMGHRKMCTCGAPFFG